MKKISCIICAYNEAPRIAAVLAAATGHSDLDEVIVVDDCSSDDTVEVVERFPTVKLIALPKNGGKSKALVHGLNAATNETIMLLDADLQNITEHDISALARPVLLGEADVSISLRKNAFGIHHAIGLDFTSGERVIPKSLLNDVLHEINKLPKFGIESYMNQLIIARRMRLAVVRWQEVTHTRKSDKYGLIKGTWGDLKMSTDVLRVLSPWAIIKMNREMLKLRAGS
ncbi:MAG TPA: glycosyltransferase family 2 protein [Candidatus Paceibacterota bacterium]|jgi:glycosyltransferase involved in cell wall biosynthesis|nr:glycosyltransferase family 2 protein [Candidatus Paceibacterota bacterium]